MQRLWVARPFVMLVVVCFSLLLPRWGEAQERGLVYAAVVDQEGQPVLDLIPSDFTVTAAGTPLSIVSAELDDHPLKIALLVDNGNAVSEARGDTALREALGDFLDTLAPQHDVGVFTISRNLQRRIDFTSDREELKDATNSIFADSGGGARMMDGLFETWERRFDPEDAWPVFVLVLTDAVDVSGFVSNEEYNAFLDDVRSRGTTIHAVFFASQGAASHTGEATRSYAENLTSNTGDLFRRIGVITGLGDPLTEFATQLNRNFDAVSTRYRIVYEVPDGVDGGSTSVSMSRSGVNFELFVDRRLPPDGSVPAVAGDSVSGGEAVGGSREEFWNAGERAFASGDIDDAATLYEQAHQADPAWGKPLFKLALIALNKGDTAGAITYFQQVVEVDPDSEEAAQAQGLITQLSP